MFDGNIKWFLLVVGIYGSIEMKIVLQHCVGANSLDIQKGRQDKGRKTVPRAGARGLSQPSRCPDASSGRSSPDAVYSDIGMSADSQP